MTVAKMNECSLVARMIDNILNFRRHLFTVIFTDHAFFHVNFFGRNCSDDKKKLISYEKLRSVIDSVTLTLSLETCLKSLMETNGRKIIFFDGICGLCNGFVDFILSIDKKKQFVFSPLQSDYARNHLAPELTRDLKSVVLLMNGQQYSKSDAVIRILNELGGIWKFARIGRALPASLLNKTYDLMAENRYKLFGKQETCRLPSAEERERFIV